MGKVGGNAKATQLRCTYMVFGREGILRNSESISEISGQVLHMIVKFIQSRLHVQQPQLYSFTINVQQTIITLHCPAVPCSVAASGGEKSLRHNVRHGTRGHC